MKIYSIEVETDVGRRMVKLAAPIDINPAGDMPPHFRGLTEVLWGLVREVAAQAPSSTVSKAEA